MSAMFNNHPSYRMYTQREGTSGEITQAEHFCQLPEETGNKTIWETLSSRVIQPNESGRFDFLEDWRIIHLLSMQNLNCKFRFSDLLHLKDFLIDYQLFIHIFF